MDFYSSIVQNKQANHEKIELETYKAYSMLKDHNLSALGNWLKEKALEIFQEIEIVRVQHIKCHVHHEQHTNNLNINKPFSVRNLYFCICYYVLLIRIVST